MRALQKSGPALLACVFQFGLDIDQRFLPGQAIALTIRLDGIWGYAEHLGNLLNPMSRRSQFSNNFFLYAIHTIDLPKQEESSVYAPLSSII